MGYKIFIFTDDKEIVFNFDIYCGKIHPFEEFPDNGAGGNVVVKLTSIVPAIKSYKLFLITDLPVLVLGVSCQSLEYNL